MGLEDIIKKIENDGNKQVASIRKEAKEQVASMEKDAAGEISRRKKNHDEKVKKNLQEVWNRQLSAARVVIKKKKLLAQRSVIDDVFNQAVKGICGLPQKQYIDYLVAEVVRFGLKGSFTLILNERDRKAIGEKLIDALHDASKGALSLRLSKDVRDILGGCIIKGEDTEINASLDVLFSRLRREMEPELASFLFSGV